VFGLERGLTANGATKLLDHLYTHGSIPGPQPPPTLAHPCTRSCSPRLPHALEAVAI
jgi:hypothetical protein